MRGLILFLALSNLSTQPARAADTLCNVIKRLETADTETGAGQRRWVEFHWGFDPDSDWSWGCQHSSDKVAGQTCKWLQDHTNQEFTMVLPQGIMSCYGYSFPRHAAYDWDGMVGTIVLHGQRGRKLVLDLNYRDLPHNEVAMRLAIELDNADYEPRDLPPIAPLLTETASGRRDGN
jgi:hypothetical protein